MDQCALSFSYRKENATVGTLYFAYKAAVCSANLLSEYVSQIEHMRAKLPVEKR